VRSNRRRRTVLKKLEAIRILCDLIEQTESKRYGQMLFEIVKTRSAVFHSMDQTLVGAAIDSIMVACEEADRQYTGFGHDWERGTQSLAPQPGGGV
jgi:hypothetical protein